MRSRKIDGKALRLANSAKASASAITNKVGKAKTAKGQRNAVAKANKVKPFSENALLAWQDVDVWTSPKSLSAWASANGFGKVAIRQLVADSKGDDNAKALVALRILDGYRRYTSAVFAEEFHFTNFDRLVRIEEGKQRQGGINLGLSGYSASDIIAIAVCRAWSRAVAHALLATKAIPAGEAEMLRVALAKRSLHDFTDAKEASDFIRYAVEKTASGRMSLRRKDVTAKVAKVSNLADAFERAKSYADAFGFGASFTIGEVQREVKRVKREGVKEAMRMLEGYTPDGTFTASVETSATEREAFGFRSRVEANLDYALSVSVEDDFFRSRYEVEDEREALIEELREVAMTPAEAEAFTMLELLVAGETFDTIRKEVFDDVSDKQFARIASATQDLVKLLA